MKNKKIKLIPLLALVLFLSISSFNIFLLENSYSQGNIFYLAEAAPKSGGFRSGGSTKSFSTPKSTTIKPDSGSFSTKPNKGSSNSPGSSIKPDSGSFSTKPNNNNKTYDNKKYNTYDDYDNYPRKSRPISGNFYGFSNPFYGMMYGFRTSSWIMKAVMVITVLVILYIIIDIIRSRRR